MWRALLAAVVCAAVWTSAAALSLDGTLQWGASTFRALVSDPLRYGTACPYRPDVAAAAKEMLEESIVGQEYGVRTIVRMLRAWQADLSSASRRRTPLVLAITGPLGVGKVCILPLLRAG